MRRKAAVAGLFYPGSRDSLLKWLETAMDITPQKLYDAKGVMVPHAGYIYSGHVAAVVYSSIYAPEVAIIMGPNHTGLGTKASILTEGEWETPLGIVKIDEYLASSILKGSSVLEEDYLAHLKEHSVEVQVPFLQYLNPSIKIVPIVLAPLGIDEITDISTAISQAVNSYPGKVLVVASSDMSHYVPSYVAKEKDMKALERIVALDWKGLLRTVFENDISMCGYIPTAIMIDASLKLGAERAELLSYSNSGEVSGEEPVVGYAGVVIY
ncbi:MAG: AmmeMemoRadiSam system protein B [Candidatus Aminicenantes bacterium]|nr:AmmeMemoRadiSam system protein B [Candidatus Aminicenantes bacterium]